MMSNRDQIEIAKGQNALIASLLERVAALEFAVLTLATTHPDPKRLGEGVQAMVESLNTPPDPEWKDVIRQIERLVKPVDYEATGDE